MDLTVPYMRRVFLISPARLDGIRAKSLVKPKHPPRAGSLGALLRTREGAPIGEVFQFLSGLYFRGKLAYARRFAAPPEVGHPVVGSGVHVITPNAGLRAPDHPLTAEDLRRLTGDLITPDNPAYTEPLVRSCRVLAREIGPECDVILLGSIASPKYVDVLLDIFGDQLKFPLAFVGRGDMSRGGLLLRQVTAGEELEYAPVRGAVRTGVRPPKLAPLALSGAGRAGKAGGAGRDGKAQGVGQTARKQP